MRKTLLTTSAFALLPTAAFAHPSLTPHVDGFLAGISHPLTGLDHLLAMLSVGLWASQKGGRAMWLWPAAFVTAMVAGGVMGMMGVGLPLVEPAIIASVLVLGVVIAATLSLPTVVGVAMIAFFGRVHGNAHGLEAPIGGAGLYALGFVVSTITLHALGLAIGLSAQKERPVLVRALAVLITASGVVMALA